MKADLHRVLQKVCRWRSVFASWQLGTRLATDAECCAVKDHREVTLLLRIEVSALANLLIEKRVFTFEEWEQQLREEAQALDVMLESAFPGFKTTDDGLQIDVRQAAETSRSWPP